MLIGMLGLARTPAARFGDTGPPADAAPTVRARCEPCTIEIGKVTTITADARDKSGAKLTYKWSAPTGTFADAVAPQTQWTAPMRRQWSEERWKKEGPNGVTLTVRVDDGRGGTASDTVTVLVTRPAAKK
jgi:hypothetical protein